MSELLMELVFKRASRPSLAFIKVAATSRSVAIWITALHHEAGNQSMELQAIVKLAVAQFQKVFARFWCLVAMQEYAHWTFTCEHQD